ncbi:Ubiquitin carboxyl-terminal hydrolase 14 [Apophysomyces sp. BC1034]|nr:Ubiquitin carboxyl-terminal hydrolase 14 [Apophysomyces sp. BC1015]KAG0183373.1 Ubiquitin carboxyl-terminal hydrolase 14 [Apophysomyces sp. BC1021]KAG0194603.1 Ubiquitin carboxyl-terminal hydrolase 14 [Apophysomyces sp. BC1034]
MPIIKVSVKWSGKKFENLELDTDETPELFKTQIYSQTGVPPERQKIMVKGGMLKETTDLNKLGLKDGHVFMMMGTAGELPKPPSVPIQFIEDMTDAEMAEALEIPAGLENLGNTCYMNSTLQCLRVIPELQESLDKYQGGISGVDNRGNLTASLRELYKNMSKASEGFPPLVFWQMLRQVFPQFSQTGPGGIPMQQDAEECWSELLSVLKAKLPQEEATGKNFIEQYMGGSMQTEIKCIEAPEEEGATSTEQFSKLTCHISISTNYMMSGIVESLKEEIEKNSPSLNRTATYERKSRISRLPQYLPIQFMRFYWKPVERVKAKILRKVKFPLEFDATELCTTELQNKFSKAKLKLKEIDDKKEEKRREEKRRKIDQEVGTSSASTATTAGSPGKEEKVDWSEYIDPELASDIGSNPTGLYELCAVLTHVGRSADSGHYIAWVKKNDDEWHKFDDDKVSIVKDADIQRLDGGGDWHTAYIVLYRAKRLE